SALAEVVKRALAKSPGERYQDAHEFSQALARALSINESPEPKQASEALAPSLVAGETTVCEACNYRVPVARFCCECSAPLPQEQSLAQFPPPFVGRRDDVTFLSSRRPSGPQVLCARVVGEPGTGKSRLLDEFAQTMSAQGDHIILVEPDSWGARVAYSGLASAIRGLARLTPAAIEAEDFLDASSDARRGLHEIFRGPQRGDSRSPMERRHCLGSALRWALVRAAARGPGVPVVLIDDLERMDGPSLHAFADVIGDPPQVAALVVGAHGPGFDAGWGAERTVARRIEGLEPSDVRPLVGASGLVSLREAVLPLYLEQALRYQFEGGSEAPERLGDLIAQRLGTLDADTRRVLQGLAVLGFGAAISTVAELVQIDGIEPAINALLGRGMITVSAGCAVFSHPLLRELTMAGIPIEARRQLHRRALRIEDKQRGPIEVRSEHAYHCQEAFQALLLLEQVADRATAVGDTNAEVLALRRGLEVARREIARGELDDPMRAVLIFSRKLGASLTRAGDFADADGILQEALDLAGPASPDRAKILGALAHVSYGRKRYEEALSRLRSAISAARAAGAAELESGLEETRRAWAP
ncbi:MAG TPA: AAA family ATPase, partial [Polyangiaceae bacterium]|nr:AAA family ATPase [Polyangiaceae bacterium]